MAASREPAVAWCSRFPRATPPDSSSRSARHFAGTPSMRIGHALASLTVTLAGAACSGVPFAPKWNVDVYFPLRSPDVALQQYTMVIPPSNVSFTTAMDSDVVSSGTRQILDEDIDSLKADVIFSTQTNIAGTLDVSIAPAKANLFSVNPALALTVTIPLRVTA